MVTPDTLVRVAAYFAAEKRESLLFVLAGCAAMVTSVLLWRDGGAWRGMIIPLALVGAIQLVVGGTVYLRTDAQVNAVHARIRAEPTVARTEESARMTAVMAAFRIYKVIEIAVLALGIALVLVWPAGTVLYAAGIGCIIQGSLMLVFDLFAEARGIAYLGTLSTL